MSRNRQVFPCDTVAHLWAHAGQDSARNAGQNFYFSGPTLYSYGSHFVIAHILRGAEYGALDGVVLWNDAGYSNTTRKHKSIAWRALSRQQRETHLNLPEMNSDSARAIDRALSEKQLPDVAVTLTRHVQMCIAQTRGKRFDSGPFKDALFNARKWDKTARAFFAAANKKYPLPIIPETLPADKTARAEFVHTFSRAIIAEDLRAYRTEALQLLKKAREDASAGFTDSDPQINKRVIGAAYDSAVRGMSLCAKANREYQTLNPGKTIDPQSAKIQKALQPLADAFKQALNTAALAVGRAHCDHMTRQYFRAVRRMKTDKYDGFRLLPIRGYLPDETRTYLDGLPEDHPHKMIVARGMRIEQVSSIDELSSNFTNSISGAESYGDKWPADALRSYSDALRYANNLQTMNHGYARYVFGEIKSRVASVRAQVEYMRAVVAEKQKQVIADWLSGASNVRPSYEAGTYARIKGDIVETNRGASVPIVHACRLARVFDRVVNSGGKSWPDGIGPMVGHYRVNMIGADGSLIIGCHEFTPQEACRLRDLLTACAQCDGVTE